MTVRLFLLWKHSLKNYMTLFSGHSNFFFYKISEKLFRALHYIDRHSSFAMIVLKTEMFIKSLIKSFIFLLYAKREREITSKLAGYTYVY